MKVADGPTVRDDVAFEAPFVAQSVKEKVICAGRFAAHRVIGAHDRIGPAFHDRGAKRGSIGVRQIVEGYRHVKAVAKNFPAAVNGEVLGCEYGLQIVRVVALQAGNECHADAAGKKWIFSVGFLAAPPARVAKDVDVGRPKGETEVPPGVSALN